MTFFSFSFNVLDLFLIHAHTHHSTHIFSYSFFLSTHNVVDFGKLLLRNGADPTKLTKKLNSVLHYLARAMNEQLFEPPKKTMKLEITKKKATTPVNFVPGENESVFGYLDENSKGENKMWNHATKLVPILPQLGVDYKQRHSLEFK